MPKTLPVFYKVLLLLSFVLAGLQILVSNFTSGGGQEVTQIEAKIANLSDEASTAKNALLEFSSLDFINSKAQELGFVKPEKTVYIIK